MAALSTQAEYDAIREAIQLLTTLDDDGNRRDKVSITADGMTVTYASSQLMDLQNREKELARRLTTRNTRKRVTPDFTGSSSKSYINL